MVAAAQTLNLTWTEGPPLPEARANNAVAAVQATEGMDVYSFLGLDGTRRWDGVRTDAYRWRVGDRSWQRLPPVPGPGRLAGTAQVVGGKIYLFGGYTVAQDGSERSVPHVDIFDPTTSKWSRAAPMPVPVDDAVSGVWRDSLIYLVSGWYDRDNVANVQIYDPGLDTWQQAAPIPGPPVFGHAGAIAGDRIVYVDGVRTSARRPRFAIEGSSWIGSIDPGQPTAIQWTRLPPHPGPPLYRAAAGVVHGMVVFAGGTDSPYNYDGVGYNGVPSAPRAAVFAYDPRRSAWRTLPPLPVATMDHRAIAVAGNRLVIVGGMVADQRVTSRVTVGRLADRH